MLNFGKCQYVRLDKDVSFVWGHSGSLKMTEFDSLFDFLKENRHKNVFK